MEKTIEESKKHTIASSGKTSGTTWSLREAADLYGIERWSQDYFSISNNGSVQINAPTDGGVRSVELTEIIDGLHQRGLDMPVMLRVENLIDDRVLKLNQAFRSAIKSSNYRGHFQGVFPIKVNQQSHVIEEIARAGEQFAHGFEAGSKAELLIAVSSTRSRDALIICNGYKDEEFIDLGLQARRLGYPCFFVVETLKELRLILDRAKHWNVEPLLGVRIKLATKVDGHWANDSGDRSLFGLSARKLVQAVDLLDSHGMLQCLQMIHFHLGSQIPNIRNVREGVAEACRIYMDVASSGAALRFLDLGGGLAVDYDGSASTEPHSRNYDLGEYCVDVVETVIESLEPHGVAHPTLVTESGRWTVAPMAVLLFDIFEVTQFAPDPLPDPLPENGCEPIRNLIEIVQKIRINRLQEHYNDAIYYRDQARQLFRNGEIRLRELSLAENLCLQILHTIAARVGQLKRPPQELVSLPDQLSDIYYGNFSVFQSLPDAWAIEQVFPVMPIHRLNEKPTRKAIIADLTCDCDGKLDRFTNAEGDLVSTLDLHPLKDDQAYYLGVFLVGAYQETLGDFHNLFGDTNVASVRVCNDGSVAFEEELRGDTIADVLSYVEHKPELMLARFRATAELAVREQRITVAQRQEMLELFRASLQGYTYFES